MSITKWNAAHTASINVDHASVELIISEMHHLVHEPVDKGLFSIHIGSRKAAGWIGVAAENREQIINAHQAALERGDFVFYVGSGEHGIVMFGLFDKQPHSDWDSACTGIWVVSREGFMTHFGVQEVDRDAVKAQVINRLNEWIAPLINGSVYEGMYAGEEDGITFGPYLTEADGLADLQAQYPECKYNEEDFEKTVTYRLRK